eukprot:10488649-Alexandrium_andersonii.AAC.1
MCIRDSPRTHPKSASGAPVGLSTRPHRIQGEQRHRTGGHCEAVLGSAQFKLRIRSKVAPSAVQAPSTSYLESMLAGLY